MPGRRIVCFPGALLVEYVTTGRSYPQSPNDLIEVTDGLPPDARIVGVKFDPANNVVGFLVESVTWPETEVGQPIPRHEIKIQRVEMSRLILPS
jgi:hypothetical protein